MFMKINIYFILLISIISLISGADANQSILQLSLKESIDLALAQNYSVQIAKLRILEQEAISKQISSGYFPQITGSISQLRHRVNYFIPGFEDILFPSSYTYNIFEGKIQLTQTIFDHSLLKSIQIARKEEEYSDRDYAAIKEAVTLKTVTLYLQALRAQALMNRIEARLEFSYALLNQAEQFEIAGTGSRLETARAKIQYQNENQNLSEAKTEFELAKLNLLQWIKLEQNKNIQLTDMAKYDEIISIDLNESINKAFQQRPDLLAAQIEENIIELSVQKAKRQFYPTIGVFAQLGQTGTDPSDTDYAFAIGGTITMPFYTGGNIRGQVEQAEKQLEQKRHLIEELKSQIELEIRSATISLESSVEQVRMAQKGISAAEITLELTRSRYKAGISTNVEVIDAQDMLARAHENEIRALYNYNISRANLAKAMGNIQSMYLEVQ